MRSFQVVYVVMNAWVSLCHVKTGSSKAHFVGVLNRLNDTDNRSG